MRRMVLIVIVAMFVFAGAAYAGDAKTEVQPAAKAAAPEAAKTAPAVQGAIRPLDADGDGVITVVENEAFWEGEFKSLDVNRDGKLTVEEFMANKKAVFEGRDADKDRVLVGQEFVVTWCGPGAKHLKGTLMTDVKKIDANGDGKLDRAECEIFYSGLFNQNDKNGDGKIPLEEFMASVKDHFNRMDKDKSGFIDIKEFSYYWTGKGGEAEKPAPDKPAGGAKK